MKKIVLFRSSRKMLECKGKKLPIVEVNDVHFVFISLLPLHQYFTHHFLYLLPLQPTYLLVVHNQLVKPNFLALPTEKPIG